MRATTRYIYTRIAAYVLTILLHTANTIYMANNMDEDLLKDKKIRTFSELQYRYFTCWTFFLQIAHAILGLSCDVLILKNIQNKSYVLPTILKELKDLFFDGLVWPTTLLVFTIFWTLYLYDRELILPKFIDQVLTPTSNHIIHTMIVPMILWELMFLPRKLPESHTKNVAHLVFHMLLYKAVLIYTYIERGVWIYPVLDLVYGTIYFPIIFIAVTVFVLFLYYIQWPITRLLWGTGDEKTKSG